MACNREEKRSLPAGVPPLRSLYLYLAGVCNLACRHCWIAPGFDPEAVSGKFIPLHIIKKAVNEAKPLGLSDVKLTGGEPMLHPEFREIVNFLASSKIPITMETNGTLMGQEEAEFLRNCGYFNFVSVSVDGSTPEVHDDLRGVQGSWEQALQGIRNLVEDDYKPQMICTLHQGNVHQITEVMKLAVELGCGSVKFNHLQEIGRGDELAESKGLSVKEVLSLYKRVQLERKSTPIQVFFDVPIAFKKPGDLLKNNPGTCKVHNILGVLCGGEAALCGIGLAVPELVFGNLHTDALEDIWLGAPKLRELRESVPKKLEGICSQCIHRDRCLGACIAHNYHETGKLTAPYYFCAQAQEHGLFPESRKLIM